MFEVVPPTVTLSNCVHASLQELHYPYRIPHQTHFNKNHHIAKAEKEIIKPTATIEFSRGGLRSCSDAMIAAVITRGITDSHIVTCTVCPLVPNGGTYSNNIKCGATSSLNNRPPARSRLCSATCPNCNCNQTDSSAKGASVSPSLFSKAINQSAYSTGMRIKATTREMIGGDEAMRLKISSREGCPDE